MHKMISYSLILLIFSVMGCGESDTYPIVHYNPAPMEDDSIVGMPQDPGSISPMKYLALGDSYTIGESVAEAERWPNLLQNYLKSYDIIFSKPDILARTGWTTNELQSAIENSALKDEYDLVSLLIGVNNQYRGFPQDQQRKEFEALLLRSIAFAQGDTSRVFVVSIPDYGATPFGSVRNPEKIAKEIDEYNAINKAICERYKVLYFDITPISRQAVSNPDLIAEDDLHPSGTMYKMWVNQVIGETIVEILGD